MYSFFLVIGYLYCYISDWRLGRLFYVPASGQRKGLVTVLVMLCFQLFLYMLLRAWMPWMHL
jgi:hypothetical protein